MLTSCLILLLLFLGILISSMIFQKEMFTKLLFLNTLTNLTALFISFLGTYKINNSYIDITLIYFLLSLVVNFAYSKYFQKI